MMPRQTLLTGPVLGGLVASMLSVTTLLYLIHDREVKEWRVANTSQHVGYWPAPSGDFNWCENDYVYLPHVAELWNTVTSLCFCVGPALLWRRTRDWEVRFNLLMLVGIGLGSAVFHATLQYYAGQLLDELPMLFYVAHTTALLVRGDMSCPLWLKGCMVSLVLVLYGTAREHPLHQAGRLVMVLSFSACFVWLAFSLAKIVIEIDRRLGGDHARRRYEQAALAVLLAIASWTVDNLACGALHSLRWLPYPQLHASVWHTGMAFVTYALSEAVVLLRGSAQAPREKIR